MSTNKVYGDRPNTISLEETATRWDYDDPAFEHGIPEDFSIDQSKHSLFGASKVAADVMVQEYGRYFNMPTCCLRGGCLTGPNHSGVELHGFLSYLIKCNVEGREYKVYGYKGKQVRDNIHSEDVARFMFEFWKAPRVAEVYNLGGGKGNACSILEAFRMAERITGRPMQYRYVEENRIGDHICYYSDLRKMRAHYPAWDITKNLDQIFEEIAASWMARLARARQPTRSNEDPDHRNLRLCRQFAGRRPAGTPRRDLDSGHRQLDAAGLRIEPRQAAETRRRVRARRYPQRERFRIAARGGLGDRRRGQSQRAGGDSERIQQPATVRT